MFSTSVEMLLTLGPLNGQGKKNRYEDQDYMYTYTYTFMLTITSVFISTYTMEIIR